MRVGLIVRSPEGELVETAVLMPADGPSTYAPELRGPLEDILKDSLREAGLSTPEPVIEASDVPHLGGHWVPGPVDIAFAVTVAMNLAQNVVAAALWDVMKPKLISRLGARPKATQEALQAEMRAMLASGGDQMARTQIEGMFGVPGNELEAVSSGLSGSNGLYIYRGQDGSQFTVNVDIEDGFFLHVIRNWPRPSDPPVEGSSGDGES